jgi:hypothetical protein
VFFSQGNSEGEYRAILNEIKNNNPIYSIAKKIAIVDEEANYVSEFLAITETKENFFSEFDVSTAYGLFGLYLYDV